METFTWEQRHYFWSLATWSSIPNWNIFNKKQQVNNLYSQKISMIFTSVIIINRLVNQFLAKNMCSKTRKSLKTGVAEVQTTCLSCVKSWIWSQHWTVPSSAWCGPTAMEPLLIWNCYGNLTEKHYTGEVWGKLLFIPVDLIQLSPKKNETLRGAHLSILYIIEYIAS